MKLTDTKLSYFAGLFDGEGTIGVSILAGKRKDIKRTYFVRISINMCDAIVLRDLHHYYGGTFMHIKRTNPKHRDLYAWILTSKKAYIFLKDVYPFLMVKKEQASLALELQENIFTCKKHRQYYQPLPNEIIEYRERIKQKLHELKFVSVNGFIKKTRANSGDGCDAYPELNSPVQGDKCVTTIYPPRKRRDSLLLQEEEL